VVQSFGAVVERDCTTVALVMEFLPRGSLFRALQNTAGVALPWPLRLRMCASLASGVAYLHHHGVIHRDLKSLNVLLDSEMRPKICDFGLAEVRSHLARQTVQRRASVSSSDSSQTGAGSTSSASASATGDGSDSDVARPASVRNPVGTLIWNAPESFRGAGPSRASGTLSVGCLSH
jgi:serine/threonine protein kinase